MVFQSPILLCSIPQVRELQIPEVLFEWILDLIVGLAEHGVIHCDFNESDNMIDNFDNSEEDSKVSSRPCLSSISKCVGFPHPELAACGFTRKEQDDMDKFVEEGKDKDICSDEEENSAGMDETIVRDVDSLHLLDQPVHPTEGNEEKNEEDRQNCEGQLN